MQESDIKAFEKLMGFFKLELEELKAKGGIAGGLESVVNSRASFHDTPFIL